MRVRHEKLILSGSGPGSWLRALGVAIGARLEAAFTISNSTPIIPQPARFVRRDPV
jgi:hypothetical protein